MKGKFPSLPAFDMLTRPIPSVVQVMLLASVKRHNSYSKKLWVVDNFHIKNPIYNAIDSQVKGKFDHICTCQWMLLLLPEKSVSDISNVLLLDPNLSFLPLNEAYLKIYSTPRDKSLDGQGLKFMILGNYTVALVMRSSSILMCSRAG